VGQNRDFSAAGERSERQAHKRGGSVNRGNHLCGADKNRKNSAQEGRKSREKGESINRREITSLRGGGQDKGDTADLRGKNNEHAVPKENHRVANARTCRSDQRKTSPARAQNWDWVKRRFSQGEIPKKSEYGEGLKKKWS